MKMDYEIREDGLNGGLIIGGIKKNLEIENPRKFSKEFEEFMSQYRKEVEE